MVSLVLSSVWHTAGTAEVDDCLNEWIRYFQWAGSPAHTWHCGWPCTHWHRLDPHSENYTCSTPLPPCSPGQWLQLLENWGTYLTSCSYLTFFLPLKSVSKLPFHLSRSTAQSSSHSTSSSSPLAFLPSPVPAAVSLSFISFCLLPL